MASELTFNNDINHVINERYENINKPVVLAAAPNSQIDGEKYAHIHLIFDY